MDVLGIRVPEYAGQACANNIPIGCAVEKLSYIKSRQDIIKNMEVEIEAQEKMMSQIVDKQGESYQNAMKRLKKLYEVKKNCEASIVLTEQQLEIERASKIR